MVRAGKRFFQRALREVQEEGAGVMRIELLFRENALDLLAASAVGNKDARLRVRFLAEAAKLTRTGKPMCLLCDNRPLFQNARVIVLFYGDKVRYYVASTPMQIMLANPSRRCQDACLKRIWSRRHGYGHKTEQGRPGAG